MFNVNNINAAITAKDSVGLANLLVDLNVGEYNNLTSAQRVEVASLVVDNAVTNKVTYIETAKVATDLSSFVAQYKGELAAVNSATSITEMKAALTGINYTTFNQLSSANQLNVAEKVLAVVKTKEFAGYTTLAQIKSAIDSALVN